jgi:hypothetical protein
MEFSVMAWRALTFPSTPVNVRAVFFYEGMLAA